MVGVTEANGRVSALVARGGLVKICGLREPDHAVVAAAAGADLIGFIFAPARRQVTVEIARACVDAARAVSNGRVLAVGVFVDATHAEIERTVVEAGLDVAQLHGSETSEFVAGVATPAFRALRPRSGEQAEEIIAKIREFRTGLRPPAAIMVEGFSEHGLGGTGTRADWAVVAEVTANEPILLGGGLDPENVGAAIHRVRPLGVDVSSGVETNGVKDPAKIEAFIRAARQAFRS